MFVYISIRESDNKISSNLTFIPEAAIYNIVLPFSSCIYTISSSFILMIVGNSLTSH
ncbi:MAG: hypothetical protein AB8U25_03920 [Rickettsiales endosymbiont of Dermacentor nuttalli]